MLLGQRMLNNSTNESALRRIINFTPNWLQTEVEMLIINTHLIWDFRGVSGLVRLAGGSNREYTYFAFSGSPDLAIRVTPQDQDSTICGPLIVTPAQNLYIVYNEKFSAPS